MLTVYPINGATSGLLASNGSALVLHHLARLEGHKRAGFVLLLEPAVAVHVGGQNRTIRELEILFIVIESLTPSAVKLGA